MWPEVPLNFNVLKRPLNKNEIETMSLVGFLETPRQA
jgi:hypothetical protein